MTPEEEGGRGDGRTWARAEGEWDYSVVAMEASLILRGTLKMGQP